MPDVINPHIAMPTFESDHNHYTLGRHRQPSLSHSHSHPHSQSPAYATSPQPTLNRPNPAPASNADYSLPPLPAYPYSPSSIKHPPISIPFERHTSNITVDGFSSESFRGDSPDPHDFYRRYQDPFARGSTEGLGQSDIVVARPEDDMTAPRQQRRPGLISAKSNGSKLPPLSSRIPTTYSSRNSSTDNSPIATTKFSSSFAHTGRNRQTSLKDLVDRFNQTPDEVPPLPRKSASRSTSTNSNPPTSANNVRARTSSQSRSLGVGVLGKGDASGPEHSAKSARLHQRRGRKSEDMEIGPASAVNPSSTRPNPNTYASQSMTDLNPPNVYATPKPLFGEVTGFNTGRGDVGLGYGIPGPPRRRRGSEGSMHSPNPMFPDERNHRNVSPSSPSAWYLGVTPTLEEIKMEKQIPSLPPKMHRRTRSDFTGISPRPASPTPPPVPAPSFVRQNLPLSPTSPRTYKRDSQSRIPISSRRLSQNSDSGNSTPSTRTSSALERHSGHIVSPKGFSAIPKPGHKPISPIRVSRPGSARNSPRHGEYSPGHRSATSPRLTAYISAPLPKKSPPLRSSRPRLPVSSASTSASRARVVERLVGQEGVNLKNARDQRSRRPPELGGVDFAARRQKIQQAIFKENERQEVEAEKKRMSMAQEDPPHLQDPLEPQLSEARYEEDSLDNQTPRLESQIELDEDTFQTPAEELSKSDRELTVDTAHVSERSVLDLSQEDSPTLGGYNQFANVKGGNKGVVTPPSEPEPSSAVTADASDSVDTAFDNEPQEESPSSYQEHRTLLSHIMSMRDTSPASPTSVQRATAADESASEKDDRESIKIMLGDTPVMERILYNEPDEDKIKDAEPIEEPASRWSMSSWTSSTRSKDRKSSDDRDAPMERIEEHGSKKQEDVAHLSVSTVSTTQTPLPWSPATFASPLTNRTTLDSDTYSTINRVLDHYHDPNVLSPKMMNDVQQHIISNSPDLARQGGWDLKKVTQLYLQELARNRSAPPVEVPNPPNIQSRPAEPSLQTTNSKELLNDAGHERAQSNRSVEDSIEKEYTPPRTRLNVDETEPNPHRASLNAPTDWDMSPSISDWIHLQAADSPLDEKPVLSLKHWRPAELEASESRVIDRPPASRISNDFRPELPHIKSAGEGLGIGGLAINITEPQDDDSPTILAPPLPNHSPPPPPTESLDQKIAPPAQVQSPPFQNPYSQHLRASTGDASTHILANTDGAHRLSNPTISAQPSIPGSMSLGRQCVEASSITPETAAKTTSPTSDQKRLIKRRHIIKELVDTEHSFGQDMRVVDDIYRGTSNAAIISAEDVKTLFSNSDQIVAFSTNFLDALKQAAKGVYTLPKSKRWRSNRTSNATSYSGNTDDQSSVSGGELTDEERDRKTFIGEAFGHHMPNMEKIYGDYLKNHDAANQKLQSLQKNQKVQIWLKECRAYAHDLTSAWDLDSLLVKPVQRILKYPLLLDQLLEATPENHPDYILLDVAAREMKGISMRINDMKKRADLMEQVTNTRKRKESDVRLGLSKAFGRRTEKLKQQVGLSDLVEDNVYSKISGKFGSHFFQLQVVMRDVEMYTNDVQVFMNRFNEFILAIEAHIDVGQTSYPEVESKWRRFRMSTREMSMTALTDHVNAVRKNVIEPMTTLLKLHDGPQKLMQKRNKKMVDYARYKAVKDRGEKPDKKLTDQGEQFMAINDTLKDELPKLFGLTGKLVETCLNNFVQLQLQWHAIWRRKLNQAIDDCKVPNNVADIVTSFAGDFAFFEAQVLSLGICNGSMLADAVNLVNFLSPATTLNGDGAASPRQTSSLDLTKRRTLSISSDRSPMLPHPDFGTRNFGADNGLQLAAALPSSNQIEPNRRMRASSAVSSQGPRTPEMPGTHRLYLSNDTPASNPVRPTTAISRTITEPSPSGIRQSVESSHVNRLSEGPTLINRPTSGSTYPQITHSRPPSDSTYPHAVHDPQRASSPSTRYSGFFSSAMPMSDSPPTESPTDAFGRNQFNVIFLAASVYEFNIDRARREAGYPYLTYVSGEIFDVIGEKGELWLAKNQDDSTNQVGWIWNKHFVKLAS